MITRGRFGDDLVARAAASALAAPTPIGTRLIGVDGPSGSGKSTLAAQLRDVIPECGLIEIDDFVSWVDFGGWWPRFAEQVLEPLRIGRPARYQVRDWDGDEFGDSLAGWKELAPGGTVIIEGVTATQARFRPYLAFSIFVEAEPEVRLRRGLARDGERHRPLWERWMAQESSFFAADGTRERADRVLVS